MKVFSTYDIYHLAQQRTNVKKEKVSETKTVQKEPSGKDKSSSSQSSWTFPLMMGAMIFIFYFLLIRPQKKQRQEHEKFVAGLKKGDKVVTQSGIYGKVVGVDADIVNVEIAQGVRVKMVKAQVTSLQQPKTGAAEGPKTNKPQRKKFAA